MERIRVHPSLSRDAKEKLEQQGKLADKLWEVAKNTSKVVGTAAVVCGVRAALGLTVAVIPVVGTVGAGAAVIGLLAREMKGHQKKSE